MNAAPRAIPVAPTPAPRRHRRRRNDPGRVVIALGVAGLLAAGLAYVAGCAALTLHTYQRQRLARELRGLSVEQRSLEARVAELKQPDQVRDRALKLGMVPHDQVRYVSLLPAPPAREFRQASARP